MLETLSAPVALPPPTEPQPDRGSAPPLDLVHPITHPAATSSPQKEAADLQEGGGASADLPESGPLLFLSESLQETPPGGEALDGAGAGGRPGLDEAPPVEVAPEAQQPPPPRREKLAMLRKLGLDPPPVARLRPDDGAFVKLEPPRLNAGERRRSGACVGVSRHICPRPPPQAWRL